MERGRGGGDERYKDPPEIATEKESEEAEKDPPRTHLSPAYKTFRVKTESRGEQHGLFLRDASSTGWELTNHQ